MKGTVEESTANTHGGPMPSPARISKEILVLSGVREKSSMRRIFAVLIALCLVPALFAQGTGSAVQTTAVTLGSAQLQHLKATPVQLVSAPGSGNLLNVVSIVAQYKFGTVAYSVPNGGQISTAVGNAPTGINLAAAGFIDQTANQIQIGGSASSPGFVPGWTWPQSVLENQPLTVSNNGGAEWTTGDGTVVVTVYYTVVALQ